VFHSNIVPRYVRSTQTTGRESMWRYLYGIHNCDLNQVLTALLGPQGSHIAGFVPEGVRRAWLSDCARKRSGTLAGSGMVELWAASIPADRSWAGDAASTLVVMGADERGRMRLIALDQGAGDALWRWIAVLRNLQERGLRVCERVHLGAGAGEFGKALEIVRDSVRGQALSSDVQPGSASRPIIPGFDRFAVPTDVC
jgi:hypothetical protein